MGEVKKLIVEIAELKRTIKERWEKLYDLLLNEDDFGLELEKIRRMRDKLTFLEIDLVSIENTCMSCVHYIPREKEEDEEDCECGFVPNKVCAYFENDDNEEIDEVTDKILKGIEDSYTTTTKQGFYIGDPCYQIQNFDRWIYVLKHSEYLEKPYTDDKGTIIAHGTAYGDGCYMGSDGHEYPVDAGLIGVVPYEQFCEGHDDESLGRFIAGSGKASLDYDDGTFTITIKMDGKEAEVITIDTKGE